MKKIIISLVLLLSLSSCLGVKEEPFLLSDDLAIIEVDLIEQDIDFGGIDPTEQSYDTNKAHFIFRRYFAKDFLKKFGTEKTKFVINGQFFDQNKNPTLISFPLKSQGKIISSYMDNNLTKKTLIIRSNNTTSIKDGFEKIWLEDRSTKELIVGFAPETNANLKQKIGRTYIGKKDEHTLVFFIAESKTGKEMDQIVKNYGITDFLMMDGGPSSQFAWNNNGIIQQYFGQWETPQFFVISEK